MEELETNVSSSTDAEGVIGVLAWSAGDHARAQKICMAIVKQHKKLNESFWPSCNVPEI